MKYHFTALIFIICMGNVYAQNAVPTIIVDPSGATYTIMLIPQTQTDTAKQDQGKTYVNPAKYALFSISTDLMQYFLCQPNIDFQCRVSKQIDIGINLGLVEPSLVFAENPLSDIQYKNPGSVYSGYAFRLYCKLFPSKYVKNYWSVQIVYKSLAYQNTGFNDNYNGGQVLNTYYMSEKEMVYGGEIMHGHRLSKQGEHLYVDLAYGLGLHQKFRNYTILSSSYVIAPGSENNVSTLAQPGIYYSAMSVLTPVVSLKFGWNYLVYKGSR